MYSGINNKKYCSDNKNNNNEFRKKLLNTRKYVPVKSTNIPNGGHQKKFPYGVPDNRHVYSSYTGELVGKVILKKI